MSVKLTPEICINNAPATASWQQQTGKPQLQIPFTELSADSFFSLSLPLMRKQQNYTCMLKNLLKLYCIWTWDTLWGVFCAVLFYFMHPLWWDNYRTTSEAPSPGLEAEMGTKIIKNETSFHLNLEGFLFLFLFCFIIYIYFLFTYIYFYSYLYSFYFLFSILSLTL
jgi:hypothetical protein